jgi:hypothetical protein
VQRGDHDPMCVDWISLAAVAEGEHPHLCPALRRTSNTVSPSCTRRCARCQPMPLQPSTAHTRCGNHRPALTIST